MSVSREDVIGAYRFLLGRMPESEEAVVHFQQMEDIEALRKTFLASKEFRINTAFQNTDRYMEDEKAAFSIDADNEQVDLMLQRIAAEWRRFGETEPHWSVLTSDKFMSGRIEDNIDAFYKTGISDLGLILNPLKRSGIDLSRLSHVLDFGCGVGRLSLALASQAEHVTGIDISPPHVRLAIARAAATGFSNTTFKSIDSVADLDNLPMVDLVVSLIVLQHNPPPVMAVILRKLLRALKPGGCAVIQIPTFIEGYRFSSDAYLAEEQPSMEMNALPQRCVFEIVSEAACRMLEIREDSLMGNVPGLSYTFAMQKI